MRHPVCLPCRFPKPHCASVAHCLCHCSCCRCQLVRIYRKVENPLPFAPAASTRALTTAYLHARYAGLLLAPVQLSGGWVGRLPAGCGAAVVGRRFGKACVQVTC